MSAGPDLAGTTSPVRLRLDIAYDGTDFAGWASQPGRRTVAGVLTEALTVLFGAQVAVVVAGRTDAGVHASGQVAHLDADPARLVALTPRDSTPRDSAPRDSTPHDDDPPDAGSDVRSTPRPVLAAGATGALRRLSGLLPPDVRVRSVAVAPAGFDARFSALARHYRYRIGTTEWGSDPLRRHDIWSRRRLVDVPAMNAAAAALIGLHDFAAFCRPRPGATTIRELQCLAVSQHPGLVEVRVTADAFCHSMVRALVGALVAVGDGRAEIAAPARWLAAGVRSSAFQVAPARGLTLTGVDYPADADLAARALVTRASRQPSFGHHPRAR